MWVVSGGGVFVSVLFSFAVAAVVATNDTITMCPAVAGGVEAGEPFGVVEGRPV